MAHAWDASRAACEEARDRLASADLPAAVLTIAVSGSWGRMEKTAFSDCDLAIFVRSDGLEETAPERELDAIYQRVWQVLQPLDLRRPRDGGIFSKAASVEKLTDAGSRGRIEENVATFGLRVQLLLDMQPLYGDLAFADLCRDVAQRYADPRSAVEAPQTWRYLIHDLLRYYHSLWVHYHWSDRNDPGRWRLRCLKLRHNRVLNIAGLLAAIAVAPRDTHAVTAPGHGWTPLERLAQTYAHCEDENFDRIAVAYDRFVDAMNDSGVRAALSAPSRQPPEEWPIDCEVFTALDANAESLARELRRFFGAHTERWPEDVLQSMVF